MTISGKELKIMADKYRLKPAEIAAEAKISTSTLGRAYNDETPSETQLAILAAIEACRGKVYSVVKCKAVS